VIELPRTEYEKTLLGISGDQWGIYEDTFIPIEDAWLSSIGKGGASEQEAADIAAAESAHTIAPLEQAKYQEAFAGGVAPDSGAFIALASDIASRKAGATSDAMLSAVNRDRLDYLDEALTASQYGRGMGSEAVTGLGTSAVRSILADRESRQLDEFNRAASDATRRSVYGAAGTVAGVGLGYGLSEHGGGAWDTMKDVGEVVVQHARGRGGTITSW